MKRKTTSATKCPDSTEKIGFLKWNLEAQEKLDDVMAEILDEGLQIAATYEVEAYLAPDDDIEKPTMITVMIPIGEHEGEGPTWQFSFDDLIADFICFVEEGEGEGGPITDPATRPKAIAIRDRLRALADQIDARIR